VLTRDRISGIIAGMSILGTEQLGDLDDDARRALDLAVDEAGVLGHDRVGTEHLLLGLLGASGSASSTALAGAGATFAAARHKVVEAAGTSGGPVNPAGPSARAARALNRSVRFAHAARSDVVTSLHLLLGVLDVEGTAGQVLRRLNVDVARLRAQLDGTAEPEPEGDGDPTEGRFSADVVVCPSCRGDLVEEGVALRELHVPGRAKPAPVYTCARCGALLGFVRG
jgi:hypothetical protein